MSGSICKHVGAEPTEPAEPVWGAHEGGCVNRWFKGHLMKGTERQKIDQGRERRFMRKKEIRRGIKD